MILINKYVQHSTEQLFLHGRHGFQRELPRQRVGEPLTSRSTEGGQAAVWAAPSARARQRDRSRPASGAARVPPRKVQAADAGLGDDRVAEAFSVPVLAELQLHPEQPAEQAGERAAVPPAASSRSRRAVTSSPTAGRRRPSRARRSPRWRPSRPGWRRAAPAGGRCEQRQRIARASSRRISRGPSPAAERPRGSRPGEIEGALSKSSPARPRR